MHGAPALLLATALLGCLRAVKALGCGAQYLGFYSFNPTSYIDPTDPDYMEVYVNPNYQCGSDPVFPGDGELYYANLNYTGLDGVQTSLTAPHQTMTLATSPTAGQVFTFQFSQLPFTSLGNNNPCTVTFGQITENGGNVQYPFTITQSETQTIFYAEATSTVTATTNTVVTTTTTTTYTSSATSSILTTAASTLFTTIVEAPTPLTTSTETITPAPRTNHILHQTVYTVHHSCLRAKSSVRTAIQARKALDARDSPQPVFAFPNFGQPQAPTTYTTDTFLVTATTTTTDTDTVTETDSTTITATTTTVTVYSPVIATTTATPATSTITTTTTLAPQTIDKNRTLTIYRTIYPKNPPQCKPTHRARLAANGRQALAAGAPGH